MIPIEINGRPIDFLLDSGAASTGINQRYVEFFKIEADPVRRQRIFPAHHEPVDVPIGRAEKIRVGGIIRKKLPVLIIPFPPQSSIPGVIGMNFLKGLRFTVEMDTGTLILRETRKS
jgi:predicted aspartyl protease